MQVEAALERVRAGADVMPRSQLEAMLISDLGQGWVQAGFWHGTGDTMWVKV